MKFIFKRTGILFKLFSFVLLSFYSCHYRKADQLTKKPNIIIIYTDDVGYGDIGCYGGTSVQTPNIDRLANEGLLFTNAYACTSVCTPSRYSLLTGVYHWRKSEAWSVGEIKNVSIAPGDAGLLIDPAKPTLPSVLKNEGYSTSVIGKWHLGLGPAGGPNWNDVIKPGPAEIGFDHSFLIPVTGDRVPCVFVENGRVKGLEKTDPIQVSYQEPINSSSNVYNPDIRPDQIISYDEPSGEGTKSDKKLKLYPSFGHDQTIVNGIPRIGYMTGGEKALWKDEEIAETITQEALKFIRDNSKNPFFLYFSTHDIHVPRVPGERFSGKSDIGVYGDVIMQMDWCVGEIINQLEKLQLSSKTLIIFSSDNGPVQNDGYFDGTDTINGLHSPTGGLRGGKYSALEGGTRVPFIVRWPGKISAGISETPFSQIDLFSSLASLAGRNIPKSIASDSDNHLSVLLGKSKKGRDVIIQQNMGGTLSVVKGDWKYIEPGDGPRLNRYTNPPIELGNSPKSQLYNIANDIGEKVNLADERPDKVKQLTQILSEIKGGK